MLSLFSTPTKQKKQIITGVKLTAVCLHADWCENSRALLKYYENLKNKFDGQDILFVTLDFTNRTTRHQASLLANALNVHEQVAEYDETGVILLITQVQTRKATTKKISGVLERTMPFEEMANQIKDLLNA
ncbi:MAG: hypothetical protein EAZ85_10575 [Bacteroidetes bacterium]|nr:MAG: hypothetical protein EAZ85_10575 [Bacteroidota bacterium]TAG90127.1 MAG: hypothetical protein EAZ20_05045 [Bacteroidota bacterium]